MAMTTTTLPIENSINFSLAAYKLSYGETSTAENQTGGMLEEILYDDPYGIMDIIPWYSMKRMDATAKRLNLPTDHPSRVKAGIKSILKKSQIGEGHSWLPHDELFAMSSDFLGIDASSEVIPKSMRALVNEGKCSYEKNNEGVYMVATEDMFRMEKIIADEFCKGFKPSPHFSRHNQDKIASAIQEAQLTPEQESAVRTAISSGMCVISGVAGAGKSYVIGTIARIMASAGLRTVMSAPTGKAARRLADLGSVTETVTVHRLLGYNGRNFRHTSDDPLPDNVVIVDEFSMMDIWLLYHLLDAIDFTRTQLILVGDPNQLPPVGAGNPLRDMIAKNAVPVVSLKKVRRQAGQLKHNSTSILDGDLPKSYSEDDTGNPSWVVEDNLSNPADIIDRVKDLWQQVLPSLGYNIMEDVQLLVPMKKGKVGTAAMNSMLQSIVQKQKFGVTVKTDQTYYPGDKIIQTRNNYKLGDNGVMNGTIGQVVSVSANGGLMANFLGEEIFLNESDVSKDIDLAYALTVHKVQGSEFPCAVVVMYSGHRIMHHRNLLYTAATRAQKTCILLGDSDSMEYAASNIQIDNRKTLMPFFIDFYRSRGIYSDETI